MTLRSRCSAVLVAGFAMVVLSACGGEDSQAQADGSADEAEEPTDAPPAATPAAEAEPTESEAPTGAVEDDDTEQVDQEVGVDAPSTPTYDFSALSPIVQGFVDENGLNGAGLIVVQRDDGVIYEEYWGEFDADRISLVASSSKMISAGVLLRLADDGLLDIDAPVADVVDWGAANPDITPAQLISSRSGLVGLSLDINYPPYVCQAAYADITLQSCAETVFTTTDDDADVALPDTEFRYGGAQWQVAGAVAEVASGKSWAELIDEIYVQPCGLEALAYNNHAVQLGDFDPGNPDYVFQYPEAFNSDPSTLVPTENPSVEGGAYLTAGDYAKLLLMQLRGGMCGENRVLSSEAIDRMHTDNFLGDYGGDALRPGFGRGMGWFINRANGNVSDGGAYGSVAWLNLDLGYGVYLVLETGGDLLGSSLPAQVGPIIRAEITG